MPETEAEAAVGLVDQIAAALGYSPMVIELIAVAVFLLSLLVALFTILAVFRIRRELISLNFKILYIGRLIEQAVKKPQIPAVSKKPTKASKTKPTPDHASETSEKFKL